MGWKMVRDNNQKLLQGKISGAWRKSPDPVGSLTKKLGEELGEFAENRDPAELYDMIDVISELIHLLDPSCEAMSNYNDKRAIWGDFGDHIEWHPGPDVEINEVA